MSNEIIDLEQISPDPVQRAPPKKGRGARAAKPKSSTAAANATTSSAIAVPDSVPTPPAPEIDGTLAPISTNPSTRNSEQEPADADLPFLSISLPGESDDSVEKRAMCRRRMEIESVAPETFVHQHS